LECPEDLKIAILESFTRKHYSEEEDNPEQNILGFVRQRFGLADEKAKVYYGNGVAPLFTGAVKMIKDEGGTLILPQGAYGYFYATAIFYGIKVEVVPTIAENNFLLDGESLAKVMDKVEKPWVFINFPLVNPTGAFMEASHLQDIFAKCSSKGKFILDTVFSGLEFDGVKPLHIFSGAPLDLKYILLGGISKEYSAGGIRFGFAVSNFEHTLSEKILFLPHGTLLHAVNQLYRMYNDGNERILKSFSRQVDILRDRAAELSQVLTELGWKVLDSSGGLFLVASPVSLIGKEVNCSFSDKPIIIDTENITAVLHDKLNILINNAEWTGIPGYCRFVLSIREETFKEGIKRLKGMGI
jgi:methionine S-methyltransferase